MCSIHKITHPTRKCRPQWREIKNSLIGRLLIRLLSTYSRWIGTSKDVIKTPAGFIFGNKYLCGNWENGSHFTRKRLSLTSCGNTKNKHSKTLLRNTTRELAMTASAFFKGEVIKLLQCSDTANRAVGLNAHSDVICERVTPQCWDQVKAGGISLPPKSSSDMRLVITHRTKRRTRQPWRLVHTGHQQHVRT